jgi:Flp pilus assembly protein TadD
VRSVASLLPRLALVILAVVVVVAVSQARRDQHACAEAGAAVYRSLAPGGSAAGSARARSTLLRSGCEDSRPLLASAAVLAGAGRTREALPLARKGVADEPENAAAWFTLARALGKQDPEGARGALKRARELNPLAASPRRR